MSSTTYNAQFLPIDFRLLDHPGFRAFMRSPAFAVYMMLRRYVWRSLKKKHPIDQVNQLYRDGFLVSAMPRSVLAEKLNLRNVCNVSRQLSELVGLGVIQVFRTGRHNVFILGTWEDRSRMRNRSYVIELFSLDQIFGAEPFDQPSLDDVAPGVARDQRPVAPPATSDVASTATSDVAPTATSDVAPTATSDVAQKPHINKEENKEGNREEENKEEEFLGSLFEPLEERERSDDVIYVEY